MRAVLVDSHGRAVTETEVDDTTGVVLNVTEGHDLIAYVYVGYNDKVARFEAAPISYVDLKAKATKL